ncbi:MAG: hypothetical protein WC044_12615 [Crocinitomicaceae bacterium]
MKKEYSDNDLRVLFKEKFSEEFKAPPVGAWGNIQTQLATSNRKIKLLYFWLIPIGMLLIGGVYFLSKSAPNSEVVAANEETTLDENAVPPSMEHADQTKKISPTSNKKNENSTIENSASLTENGKVMPVKSAEKRTFTNTQRSNLNQSASLQSKSAVRKNRSTNANQTKNTVQSSYVPEEETRPVVGSRAIKTVRSENNGTKENIVLSLNQPTETLSSTNAPLSTTSQDKSESIKKDEKVAETTAKPVLNTIEGDTVKTNTNTESTVNPVSNVLAFSDSIKNPTLPPNADSSAVNTEKYTNTLPLITDYSLKRFRFDYYVGLGRSPRANKILTNDAALILTDNIVRLKNRMIGMNIRYQMTPHIGVRSGVVFGVNRYRTRLFPVAIANDQLNQNVEIATADGLMRATGLESNALSSNNVDTSTYLMRVFHRSSYLSVPVSLYFNSTMKPKKMYFYGMSGFDFSIKGRERSLLIVRSDVNERSIALERLNNKKHVATNWHASVGLSYPFSNTFEIFGEFNYALNISNRLKNNYLNTKYSYFQLMFGIRF